MSDEVTIISNNVPRLLDEDYGDEGFVYRGERYSLADFSVAADPASPLRGWDGYRPDSYFSGVVVRFVPDDPDRVIVGRYYC